MKLTREIEILNSQGLHARPATALVNLTSRFKSQLFLVRDEKKINAKSILGVLVLAAEKGAKLRVEAEGTDAQQALDAIAELAVNKFGMSEE
ncbi:MAG TPA: HPr family phosphocarrier protein [Candidatus Marinimicrobia bacterium]|nr:HPr family phosphocarrier protein [Candidatus Neomarinimicrobiota bacterium]